MASNTVHYSAKCQYKFVAVHACIQELFTKTATILNVHKSK